MVSVCCKPFHPRSASANFGGRDGGWQHVRKNFCQNSVLFHVEASRYYTLTPKL